LTKLNRREEILVSELSDDAPERVTVHQTIIKRSKKTITTLTTAITTLKTKITKITTQLTTLRTTITELTTKVTKVQTTIITLRETLKLKIAERKSKRDIIKSYGTKTGGEQGTSPESAIVTQTMITKITEEIKELRKTLKITIQ
jgi:DNA repair exonuclease SbcCD ATPase subunit